MSRTYPVACFCGWNGRRVRGACPCEEAEARTCRCASGAICPKCGGRVYLTDWERPWMREVREGKR